MPFIASGYDPLDSLFEVASAAGTAGLMTGISRTELEGAAARVLTEREHKAVIIDADREKLDALGEGLDIGLLRGDGTRPELLREADPGGTDCLFCLTESDQSNLIASLVGRSLGFRRVVTRIEDAEFEHIALELEGTVVPARTIGRHLADMVAGFNALELSAAIEGDARVYVFVAREAHAGSVEELGLPKLARATHLYRGDRFVLIDPGTKLAAGDEVVVITHADSLEALHQRWGVAADRRGTGTARHSGTASS